MRWELEGFVFEVVPTNLGLALPIVLIQHSNELLERVQFVLESGQD